MLYREMILRQNTLVSLGVCGHNFGAMSAADVLVQALNVLFSFKQEQRCSHALTETPGFERTVARQSILLH